MLDDRDKLGSKDDGGADVGDALDLCIHRAKLD